MGRSGRIGRGDADDVDGHRGEVGEDAVEVGGVSNHAGELCRSGAGVVDGEVVAVDEVDLASLEAWLMDRPVCTDTVTAALPLLMASVESRF